MSIRHHLESTLLTLICSCIFQDNLDDWEGEASHMREVYSQAACTIAATAAKDSGEGLFFGRNPELLRPRRVYATWSPNRQENGELDSYLPGEYWCDHYETWTDCVENAPLNSRAWVSANFGSYIPIYM